MTDYKRILTIQDISCVGQCSLTVALPILSACGLETAILPSAVLSTHTSGFTGWTCRDLTDDFPAVLDHWTRENISFDAVYTGYLGSARQIEYVRRIAETRLRPGGTLFVDPAMADNGKLYPAFNAAYVEEIKGLVGIADVVLPNITEACLLTGTPFRESYDEAYALSLVQNVARLGARIVVLTGVGYAPDTTGVLVYENGAPTYYRHKKIQRGCHGTGDVYASAFCGAILRGKSVFDAARIAADFTVRCIETTLSDPDHWYGVRFEPVLAELIEAVAK